MLEKELRKIARLPHPKNEFMSQQYRLNEYPSVLEHITFLAAEKGYTLPTLNRFVDGADNPNGKFEIQTHTVSVPLHTDDFAVGNYLGLLPVASKLLVKDMPSHYTTTPTLLRFYEGHRKREELLQNSLIIFSPWRPHELIYYGEATTFILFALRKRK